MGNCKTLNKTVTSILLDNINFTAVENELHHELKKASSRTISVNEALTWNYLIESDDADAVLNDNNCFPSRCYQIPYKISSSGFTFDQQTQIRNAMKEIETDTCIRYSLE